MNDLLLVTWDGGGNVPPMLAIGAELQARGHRVRVMGHPQQAEAVAGAGLVFVPFTTAHPFDSTGDTSPPSVLRMFGDRAMGRDVMALIEADAADLVVVDCLLWGPMEALRKAGQRYVVLEHLFDRYLRSRWLKGPLGLALKAKRFAPARSLAQAERCLVGTLPHLDPTSGVNVVQTGPAITGVPASPSAPTILVSLSTFNFPGQAERLQRVLDAVSTLDDVRVTVTTGPAIDPAALHAAANTELHRWLAHAEVLPVTSLVIGHGGHATSMAALAHGIPLIVLPSHPMLDQPMVGQAIERAGAGRVLSPKASVETVREAVRGLLSDGPHRAAAARLGEEIRAMDGTRAAADHLESLVNGAVPARR